MWFGIPRWQVIMLALGLAGYIASFVGAPPLLIFALSALGLIPLAGLIGRSTEDLAHYIGPKWGGLLNATFGNAAELIIAGVALRAGLISLVKASITGSIIGNILLVLGSGLIFGGLRHGVQRFDAREAGRNSTMMLLAIFGLILPATFNLADPNAVRVEEVSLIVAVVLLIIYFAYIAYSFTASDTDEAMQDELHVAEPSENHNAHTPWSRRTAMIVLAGATVATVLLSETLVGEVEAVIREFGVSEFFLGAIVVPLVGNVAEHFSGITLAGKNKMDIALGIAAGSSTQVALLVAPLLVLLSLVIGPEPFNLAKGMNLVFLPMEIVAVTAAGFLFNYISHDGETNWLEGLQLVSLYIILAAIFFLIQIPEAGGGH